MAQAPHLPDFFIGRILTLVFIDFKRRFSYYAMRNGADGLLLLINSIIQTCKSSNHSFLAFFCLEDKQSTPIYVQLTRWRMCMPLVKLENSHRSITLGSTFHSSESTLASLNNIPSIAQHPNHWVLQEPLADLSPSSLLACNRDQWNNRS
jgi:hypothetical protein